MNYPHLLHRRALQSNELAFNYLRHRLHLDEVLRNHGLLTPNTLSEHLSLFRPILRVILSG